MTILCKIAICSGFNAGGLPPALLDGSVPSSGCVVATACSSHIEIACHNFVVDFVSPSLFKSIAEGVETEAMLAFAKAVDVDLVQGWFVDSLVERPYIRP